MTLRRGSTGPEVETLQAWLVGQGLLTVIDGQFGPQTELAVMEMQTQVGTLADGIVGPATTQAFALAGLTSRVAASDYPPPPAFRPLTALERQRIWGEIRAVPEGNRSDVQIVNDWQKKHLVRVTVPQLVGIRGAPKGGAIFWHRKAVGQLFAFWSDVERERVLPLVLTWAGSWAPRFVRGSVTTLSSHAHATAFDINAQWNGLGVAPAERGMHGSVVDLVPIAHRHGFYWGGHFSRPDGMHFQCDEARP